jgi:hypothetical protein
VANTRSMPVLEEAGAFSYFKENAFVGIGLL